jgi:hypothetical protein
MAYRIPELLLVGAAQNLILCCSIVPELKDDMHCVAGYPQDIDVIRDDYDTIETW